MPIFILRESIMTFAELSAAVYGSREAVNKRTAEIVEAQAINNGGIAPTRGVDDRLHAPCDGYLWYDRIYLGGQYLAIDEDSYSNLASLKIKIVAGLKDQLIELFGNGSTGKVWNRDGVDLCYFYAECARHEYTAIRPLLPKSGKYIVLVSEHGGNGQRTWKFSSAKILASPAYQSGMDWEDLAPGVNLEYEQGRKVKGQLREFFTQFDGQLVRYQYFDDVLAAC